MPLPVPPLPEVTVMNGALLAASHAQPEGAVTPTEAPPPAEANAALAGEIA